MTVQSLKGRERKGKIITAAGWFEDGTIRYVIYDTIAPQVRRDREPDAPPPRMRGALAAEQADLFGQT